MDPVSILALAPLLPLSITLVNLLSWTRGQPGRSTPTLSVLIPARNEAQNIGRALEALRQSELRPTEILVYDDHSTDETAALVRHQATMNPAIRLLSGGPLPAGWVGKVHACARLAEAATGEWLVYLDADVCITKEGLGRITSLLSRADVVTAVPRQETGSWAEHAVLPLLHLTYHSWLPLFLVEWSQSPAFLAANGQILAMRADALRAMGGWESVRSAVVDDMALCRRAKSLGWRVIFADGDRMGSCRMYHSFPEVWEGFSKNIRLGIGSTPGTLAVVLLYFTCFLLPFFLLPLAPVEAAVGVAGILLQRLLLAWRHQQSGWGLLLHPVGVVVLLAIALNSVRWAWSGDIRWKGRVYASKGLEPG
ncbi:MAG TPA: glycosyltransferase family 2 protein [Myxococcota bacterium]|nr:glycosyltransferase family 2 protein [Myxococcota bacterium]